MMSWSQQLLLFDMMWPVLSFDLPSGSLILCLMAVAFRGHYHHYVATPPLASGRSVIQWQKTGHAEASCGGKRQVMRRHEAAGHLLISLHGSIDDIVELNGNPNF